MKCPTCPVAAGRCLGESVSRLCVLARDRADYRGLLLKNADTTGPAQTVASGAGQLNLSDLLARITACPERGSVLPLSIQPECGCSELTECRAGKGAVPGRVTTRDCLACVFERQDPVPAAPTT